MNVLKKMHSQIFTVRCAFRSGRAIGLYFFENSAGNTATVNGERYREILNNFYVVDMYIDRTHTQVYLIQSVTVEQQAGKLVQYNQAAAKCDLRSVISILLSEGHNAAEIHIYGNHFMRGDRVRE